MENIMNSIYNAFNINKSDKINSTNINDIIQGKNMIKKRSQKLQQLKLNKRKFESMDLKKNNTHQNNSKFRKLENNFNEMLSNYESSYTDFMTTYNNSIKNVKDCKTKCMQDINTLDDETISLHYLEACSAGCELNGPYIKQCEDTYGGLRENTEQKCSYMLKHFTQLNNGVSECVLPKNRDIKKGSYLPSATHVNSEDYIDKNRLTVAEGCCKCGGGSGGPPTYKLSSGEIITKCSDLLNKYKQDYPQLSPEQLKVLENSCLNNISNTKGSQLWEKYNDLNKLNTNMMAISQQLINLITDIKDENSDVNKDINQVNSNIKSQLKSFTNLYPKTTDEIDETLNAQLEDVILMEQSSSIKYYIWTILAITMLLITLHQMKK
jgi:hypothetical protein